MVRITDLDVLMALHPVEWRHGRQILELICEAQGQKRSQFSGFGGLYTTLHRLQQNGLAEGQWGNDSEIIDGARRRYYRLTSDGYRRRVELESQKEAVGGMLPQPSEGREVFMNR